MSILATLTLMAATLVSCDEQDAPVVPNLDDPNYFVGKSFSYKGYVGSEERVFEIKFEVGTFEARVRRVNTTKPGHYWYDDRYFGPYSYKDKKLTTKVQKVSAKYQVGDAPERTREDEYQPQDQPILFIGQVDVGKGTISGEFWRQSIVLRIAQPK